MRSTLRLVHAILIERDGKLIYEEYFDGIDERPGTSSCEGHDEHEDQARSEIDH
jgi:hypothetical protein